MLYEVASYSRLQRYSMLPSVVHLLSEEREAVDTASAQGEVADTQPIQEGMDITTAHER